MPAQSQIVRDDSDKPLSVCDIALPGQIFCVDFNDGDLQDGSPVTWTAGFGINRSVSVESGDLELSGAGVPELEPDVSLGDLSIRARVRLADVEDFLGFEVRKRNNSPEGHCNYFAWLDADSEADENTGLAFGCSIDGLGPQVALDFDATEEDAILQLDAFGNTLQLWVWPADEPKPQEPTVAVEDDTFSTISSGIFGLWVAGSDALEANPTDIGTGTFRYVQVASEPLDIYLDCNGDQILDVSDVNCIDTSQRDDALGLLGLTAGDADGSGLVDFADFLILADNCGQGGEYTSGDFDKDGEIEFDDFLILANNFGREIVTVAVPEPSSLTLLFGSFLSSLLVYKRR